MTRIQLAFLASLWAVSPGLAQTIDCRQAQTSSDKTACARNDWDRADFDLSEAYRAAQAAMRAVDAGRVEAQRGAFASLRAAERAWITYRDATCLSESFASIGQSRELTVIYACRARITEARTAELWSLAHAR